MCAEMLYTCGTPMLQGPVLQQEYILSHQKFQATKALATTKVLGNQVQNPAHMHHIRVVFAHCSTSDLSSNGIPKSRENAIRSQKVSWKETSQEKIQAWIERNPVHMQKVIDLEGGNEYKGGQEQLLRPILAFLDQGVF